MAGTAGVIAGGADGNAALRIGTVRAYDAGAITVDIGGGTLVGAAYLMGQYVPAVGDQVAVLQSGATWLVAGAISGPVDGNAVVNYSFQDDTDGVPATGGWRRTHSGAMVPSFAVAGVPLGREIDGNLALLQSATGPGSSDDTVESGPIPVAVGQRWTANAWVLAEAFGAEGGNLVRLLLTWYATDTDGYAARLSETTLCSYLLPIGLPWIRLRPGGTSTGTAVPAGAAFMRVQLDSSISITTGLDLYYDRVVAVRTA